MRYNIILSLIVFLILAQPTFGQKLEDVFLKSYSLEKQGLYFSGAEALREVYDEKSYELNLRMGYLYYMAKYLVLSEIYYAKAVELMPNSIEAKFGYVLPLSSQGKWIKVKEVYEDILKIDTENSLANYRLGYIAYYNKEYDRAYTLFEKVVSHFPFDYYGLLMFAWTNYQLGKTKEAQDLFNQVLLLYPGDISANDGLNRLK